MKKNILLTYHPVTYLNEKKNYLELKNTLKAIDCFHDFGIIITFPNADFYNQKIIDTLINYSRKNKNAKLYKYLGREKYLSCLKEVDVVVGNSSSGITEAPFLGTPTVNIGIRQDGRAKSASVIDTSAIPHLIVKNIKKALSKEFREKIVNQKSFYGNGFACKKIVKIIEKKMKKDILIKKFHYI